MSNEKVRFELQEAIDILSLIAKTKYLKELPYKDAIAKLNRVKRNRALFKTTSATEIPTVIIDMWENLIFDADMCNAVHSECGIDISMFRKEVNDELGKTNDHESSPLNKNINLGYLNSLMDKSKYGKSYFHDTVLTGFSVLDNLKEGFPPGSFLKSYKPFEDFDGDTMNLIKLNDLKNMPHDPVTGEVAKLVPSSSQYVQWLIDSLGVSLEDDAYNKCHHELQLEEANKLIDELNNVIANQQELIGNQKEIIADLMIEKYLMQKNK